MDALCARILDLSDNYVDQLRCIFPRETLPFKLKSRYRLFSTKGEEEGGKESDTSVANP